MIWHFASLPKVLSMLSSSSLYFRNIGGFEDREEGAYTEMDRRIVETVQKAPYDKKRHEPFDSRYYVNCWTLSNNDRLEFWYRYAPGPYGIAIKSNIHRLKAALFKDQFHDVYISPVHYINRPTESSFRHYWEKINIVEKCFTKGDSYEWEKELRLLHIDTSYCPGEHPSGLLIKVDLPSLIDEVYVSPMAELWFAYVVEDLMRRYEVGNKTVKISNALKR